MEKFMITRFLYKLMKKITTHFIIKIQYIIKLINIIIHMLRKLF